MPDQLLEGNQHFGRSGRYHPDWVMANASGGANPLRLTEWLAEALDLRANMRVLDLGCGRATSSIFLHRQFGVQMWATDRREGQSKPAKTPIANQNRTSQSTEPATAAAMSCAICNWPFECQRVCTRLRYDAENK
jgi:ubiquinone/menaquinone biosynthesis C-methylase UbiE